MLACTSAANITVAAFVGAKALPIQQENRMNTPILPVQVPSIYLVGGQRTLLPKRMAHATPDMKMALHRLGGLVAQQGGAFVLSDLYRSYDMQLQAHVDYVSKKKTAFSPAPGGSLHEAGRAFDVDLKALDMPLADFWDLAIPCGVVPIISQPDPGMDESWHFECRGSHQLVYDYYAARHGDNFKTAYAAMAASAINATGVKVDKFGANAIGAGIQSALIRLGKVIGNIDGTVGPKTREALADLQLDGLPMEQQVARLEFSLQAAFPGEYFDKVPLHEFND